jgi:hypothetical protein
VAMFVVPPNAQYPLALAGGRGSATVLSAVFQVPRVHGSRAIIPTVDTVTSE